MMGPDYTHWHGMYEVAKHFYEKFLPAVVETTGKRSVELRKKYKDKIVVLLSQPEHIWRKGLSSEEAEALRKTYKDRYGQ